MTIGVNGWMGGVSPPPIFWAYHCDTHHPLHKKFIEYAYILPNVREPLTPLVMTKYHFIGDFRGLGGYIANIYTYS